MSQKSFKFGHLTDIHLPIRRRPPLRSLMNKRILGYLSWKRRRHKLHQQWVTDLLCSDHFEQELGAAVISGDLVNIALEDEFDDARSWLGQQFDGLPVLFAPGNHDTYVNVPWQRSLGKLSPYMSGRRLTDTSDCEPSGFDDFPYVRDFGENDSITMIMANSSPTTAPGLASGSLGDDQIARIETALAEAGAKGQYRILVLHHPIVDGAVSARKSLTDRHRLRACIKRVGVELVLHGHAHVPTMESVETPTGKAPVVGGGSASHPHSAGKYVPGRYNLFEITVPEPAIWKLEMKVRQIDPVSRTVSTVETYTVM